jgi:23S rRNA (adenine2030-N6)-methyltransferase
MLSYQHAYHAGNEADVMKHALLAQVLLRLVEKPAPLTYIETHAGRGLYPLDAAETQKKAEYRAGALRLWHEAVGAPLAPYRAVLQALNAGPELAVVPGSPAVARHCLRPGDHLHLFERHPQEVAALQATARRWADTHVHAGDGLAGAAALIKGGLRALVLIDPPYEQAEEYQLVPRAIAQMLARRPQLTLMLWYPLLAGAPHRAMLAAIAALRAPATWQGEIAWPSKAADGRGLQGTGMLILNLPYQLETRLAATLAAVGAALDLPSPRRGFLVAPR